MKALPVALFMLLLMPTVQAGSFALHNTTLIQPTQANTTYKLADYFNMTRLVVQPTYITIGVNTLKEDCQNSLELTVLEFSTLSRKFLLTNSTPDENTTITMTGLPSSVTMILYSNTTTVGLVATNSTGGVSRTFSDFTGYTTLFSLQKYDAPPPPGGGGPGSGGEEPTTIPPQTPCTFSIQPQKLVGTGTPGEEIYPAFTAYITNPYLAQNFSILFDDMVSLNCFVDYSNGPNTGVVQPNETVKYIIKCISPAEEEIGIIEFKTNLGCTQAIEVDLIPTRDVMTEIDVAFIKMSFGDIEGFLASKILGISVIVWIMIALMIMIIIILVLSILVLGGR